MSQKTSSQPLPQLPKAVRLALLAAGIVLLAALGYWAWRPAEAGVPAAAITGIVFMTPAETSASEIPPVPTPYASILASSPSALAAVVEGDEAPGREIMSDGKININWTGEKTLCTLPGIGEKRAQAILAYREEHGLFFSIDDLLNVHNITAKVLEGIRDRVTVRYY